MTALDHHLDDTPIAVLDFETTGLSPLTGARVVEVSIVRIEPGGDPELILDTLVDPEGPVHATRIHGIEDEDVVGAPRFADLVDEIAAGLEGAVVAAYNASFDMQFLAHEFGRVPKAAGFWTPPHVCLMYLRPGLGIGPRCRLDECCAQLGLPPVSHRAAEDALAEAVLWQHYLPRAREQGFETFEDLQRLGYKFTESFRAPFLNRSFRQQLGIGTGSPAMKPRDAALRPIGQAETDGRRVSTEKARRAYWHALVETLIDDSASNVEVSSLAELHRRLGLPESDLMALHARYFADVLHQVSEDAAVSGAEQLRLSRICGALRALGWAPGDLPA